MTPHFRLDNNVIIFSLFPGIREDLIRHIIHTPNLKAIVMRTFGSGNAPQSPWLLKALKEGTAVITATSVATKNFNTFTVVVTPARPSLKAALQNIVGLDNYTFVGRPLEESEVTDQNTYITKRVEKALTLTTGEGQPVWLGKPEEGDPEDLVYHTLEGIVPTSDGQTAIYLRRPVYRNENNELEFGDYENDLEAIKTNEGFLNETNFAGSGAGSSPSQTQFSALGNINPAWLGTAGEKTEDNVYVIGDSGNDVPMFEAFYENSFCMGHAPQSIREKAKHVVENYTDLEHTLYPLEDSKSPQLESKE
jgi:hypothetical protein